MKFTILSLFLTFAGVQASAATYIGVQTLGATELSWGGDHDTVAVTSCARGFAADAVLLKVTRNTARIDYISIRYGDGSSEELYIRRIFDIGSSSRWIGLGGLRCIRSFEIYGRTAGIPIRKTKVTLYGNAYSR